YDGPTGIGTPNGTGFPTATTNPATGVTQSSATLNGTVNPNGQATSYKYDYGTTIPYASSTTSTNIGAGTTGQSAPFAVSGLSANTTYHYRAVATNASG